MVWYGVVWYGVVWYGMVWYGMVWCGMVWYGMVWYGMVWNGVVWCGMVWCGMVWYGVVWYGVVWYGVVWDINSFLTVTGKFSEMIGTLPYIDGPCRRHSQITKEMHSPLRLIPKESTVPCWRFYKLGN